VAPKKNLGCDYVSTIDRASIFARFSHYFSAWTIALPTVVGIATAAALAVIFQATGGTEGWVLHPAALKPMLLVAALVAGCCLPLGAREGRSRPLRLWRLFRLPVLAACITIILLALGSASHPPLLILATTFGAGLLIGVSRGLTMTLQFDRVWSLISLPRTMDTLCVAILLILAAGMSMGGALVGSGGAPCGLVAIAISVLCAPASEGQSPRRTLPH
jgi:hypothetical protein